MGLLWARAIHTAVKCPEGWVTILFSRGNIKIECSHHLSGIVAPVNPAASALGLEHPLRSSNAVALFIRVPLLENALKAAKAVGIPNDRIFILPMQNDGPNLLFTTTEGLLIEGKSLPGPSPIRWPKIPGARQIAYLCSFSGTSGPLKAVMASHYNVIVNILQLATYESFYRKQQGIDAQALLGLLPFSHTYGLIGMVHVASYRGDKVIVLLAFKLDTLLMAVQRSGIEQINIAPPILIAMIAKNHKYTEFDLSSIHFVYKGGAPLAC